MAYGFRALFAVVWFGTFACGGTGMQSNSDGADLSIADLSIADLSIVDADYVLHEDGFDPCGPKFGPRYGCAFLIGGCSNVGLQCPCWERGTMVCQANAQWELILDTTRCPALDSVHSYSGLGCLGASTTCTDPSGASCVCDDANRVYMCGVGLE